MNCVCNAGCEIGFYLFKEKFGLTPKDMEDFRIVGDVICDIIHSLCKEEYEAVKYSSLSKESLLIFLKTIRSGEIAADILFKKHIEDLPVYESDIKRNPEDIAMFYNFYPTNFVYSNALSSVIMDINFLNFIHDRYPGKMVNTVEKCVINPKYALGLCQLTKEFIVISNYDEKAQNCTVFENNLMALSKAIKSHSLNHVFNLLENEVD